MEKRKQEHNKRLLYLSGILAVVRVLISKHLNQEISPYDIIGNIGEAVSVTLLLGWLYRKYIWRFKFVKWESMPRLYKRYSGVLKSSYDGIERPISLEIKQTLLSAEVRLISDESRSDSVNTTIKEINGQNTLLYTYLNEPMSAHRDHSPIHYGTAKLSIISERELKALTIQIGRQPATCFSLHWRNKLNVCKHQRIRP